MFELLFMIVNNLFYLFFYLKFIIRIAEFTELTLAKIYRIYNYIV